MIATRASFTMDSFIFFLNPRLGQTWKEDLQVLLGFIRFYFCLLEHLQYLQVLLQFTFVYWKTYRFYWILLCLLQNLQVLYWKTDRFYQIFLLFIGKPIGFIRFYFCLLKNLQVLLDFQLFCWKPIGFLRFYFCLLENL